MQKVIRRWSEQFLSRGAIEPRYEVSRLEDHGHSAVNLADKIIRLGDDHCAGLQPRAGFDMLPFVPQPGDRYRLLAGDEPVAVVLDLVNLLRPTGGFDALVGIVNSPSVRPRTLASWLLDQAAHHRLLRALVRDAAL